MEKRGELKREGKEEENTGMHNTDAFISKW
jgi:hypothetical protein